MARIELNLSANSKPMSDEDYAKVTDLSFDNNGNGIEIIPHSEDFPLPWDADCWIENNNLVLSGGAGPSGFGSCTTEIPLNRVSSNLDMEIYADNDEVQEELESIFRKYGWL